MDTAEFIVHSPTRFHAIATIQNQLAAIGARQFLETESWKLTAGSLGYIVRDGSALIAFRIGQAPAAIGWRLAAAHTDSPGLRLRPASAQWADGLLQIGTELYGSPIVSTWLDRDLAVAGLALVRAPNTDAGCVAKPFVVKDLRAVVPNLAIHLNREVNKGFEYNPQLHLKAYLGLTETTGADPVKIFEQIIAAAAGVPTDALIMFEANLTDDQPNSYLDQANRLLHGPRLDNQLGCQAITQAFIEAPPRPWTQLAIFYDHEEIGSRSGSGAESSFASEVINRLHYGLDAGLEDLQRSKAGSLLVSVDAAHARHPSYPDKHDAAYAPRLGRGIVLKTNGAHKYAGTVFSQGRAVALWRDHGLTVQSFTNRADMACGSTIGPISESWLGMPTLDVGVGIWAMHSLRELGSLDDQAAMIRALGLIYGEKLL
jgi:aspartyl aminopeptidase